MPDCDYSPMRCTECTRCVHCGGAMCPDHGDTPPLDCSHGHDDVCVGCIACCPVCLAEADEADRADDAHHDRGIAL